VNSYLTAILEKALYSLSWAGCVAEEEDEDGQNVGHQLGPTTLGRIASYYYLSHETVQLFDEKLNAANTAEELLTVLTDCKEYEDLPVRHNEDETNAGLAKSCPLALSPYSMDSPHVKAHLLLQSHFCRNPLPVADYATDTKSVLDQAVRILQAMLDISADSGWLATTLRLANLLQMVIQGRWHLDPSLLCLPHVDLFMLAGLRRATGASSLAELINGKGKCEEGIRFFPNPNIIVAKIGFSESHSIQSSKCFPKLLHASIESEKAYEKWYEYSKG